MESRMISQGICVEIECMVRKFIWRNSAEGKKLALMSWKSICQPRSCGGDVNKIKCWSDNWASSVGPLVNQIPSHDNLDLEFTLKNLGNADGY
ncbi:hypothetical protein EPI10_014829 [Gossypium australe]|uniref:Reverse transcriptase n=1 Tax=Gossypium australe TaxID=47621 RepID=A0A5B6VIV4_9ROSI|nr:hypothetical protein EPI10_014829 [Gossypium australe]